MALDPGIGAALVDLRDAFNDATPLESAPPLVFAKLRDKARDLVDMVDAAVAQTGVALDAPELPAAVVEIPALLRSVAEHNVDESTLCDLRSLAGRIRTNINQSVG